MPLRERIAAVIDQLANDKVRPQKLEGKPTRYKIRVGDWRIILLIDNTTAYITRIGHRREIYKRL